MNITICCKGDDISWDDLADLLHESFQERLQQGLHFSCSYLTANDLEAKSNGDVVLVAVDTDDNILAGTVSFEINSKEQEKRAYHYNLAVRPQYKHHGIATQLLQKGVEIVKEHGCEYIISDTAVGAKSSVHWHLKNGFRIVGLKSFSATNYYSYLFRLQLNKHPLWNNVAFCKMCFLLSAAKCRICYMESGKYKVAMNLYIRFRRLILKVKETVFN